MYCEICGTEIGAGDAFCPGCGALVEDYDETVMEPVPAEGLPEIKPQRQVQPQTPPQSQSPVQTPPQSQSPVQTPPQQRPVQRPTPVTQTSAKEMGLPEINSQRPYTQTPPQRPVQPQQDPYRYEQTPPQQDPYITPQQDPYSSAQQDPYRQTQPQMQMPSMEDIAGKVGDISGKVSDISGKVLGAVGNATKNIPVNVGPGTIGEAQEVVLADGEQVVKRYNCADVRGVMGYMIVTNKRLMFTATGGKSRYNQEVTLSSVSGLTSHRGTNIIWSRIAAGVIVALTGLSIFSSMGDYGFGDGMGIGMIGFMLMIFGAIIFILGLRPAYQVAIYAKDVSLSPIVVGEGPKTLIGNSALYAFACKPTPETEVMLSELGALIQDLQSMGDLAIEKWQNIYSTSQVPKI
ncbi:MAG: hypothetical protein IJJ31_01890 [Mogibacterium sp.]|nr:hypothetical protein [Mogibacterium sp.]